MQNIRRSPEKELMDLLSTVKEFPDISSWPIPGAQVTGKNLLTLNGGCPHIFGNSFGRNMLLLKIFCNRTKPTLVCVLIFLEPSQFTKVTITMDSQNSLSTDFRGTR